MEAAELLKKKSKDWTLEEYSFLIRNQRKKPYSSFATFMIGLVGYDLHFNGKKIDKWEAWHIAKNHKDIIAGTIHNLKAVKRGIK